MTTITLPADQIGDGILIVEGEQPCTGQIGCGAPRHTLGCFESTMNDPDDADLTRPHPPQWVLGLLEPCDTCGGDGRLRTDHPHGGIAVVVNGRCLDCYEGRRPFTLQADECDYNKAEQWCEVHDQRITDCKPVTVGVFVVTDVQPRDDGRYNVLITEVSS